MRPCEQVFQADSAAVLEIVEALDDELLAAARWKLAAAGMDGLLEGLGLSAEERLLALRTARDGFAREHRADQKLLRQIGERYRAEREAMERVLDPRVAMDGPLAGAAAALTRLTEQVARYGAQLRTAAERGELSLTLVALAPSLLHMHANRLLRSDHRRQEMVLYDFLYRLSDARAARSRAAVGTGSTRTESPGVRKSRSR